MKTRNQHPIVTIRIAGLVALRWTGALGRSILGRLVAVVAVLGLAVTELAAILPAHDTKDSPFLGLLGAAYGVVTVLLGAALVWVGVAVVRAGLWQDRRRWIPLALDVWVFVPMLPALGLALVRNAEGIVQKSPLAGQPDRSEHLLPKPALEEKRIP